MSLTYNQPSAFITVGKKKHVDWQNYNATRKTVTVVICSHKFMIAISQSNSSFEFTKTPRKKCEKRICAGIVSIWSKIFVNTRRKVVSPKKKQYIQTNEKKISDDYQSLEYNEELFHSRLMAEN